VAEDPRRLAAHQLAQRRAEDVLVGMDVDRAAVDDLTNGTLAQVDPSRPLSAEQHAFGGDVQDQQVGAVSEAQPRSSEEATDRGLVAWAEPLVAEHLPERGVQRAAVGQVDDREARIVEAGSGGPRRREVTKHALAHVQGRAVERAWFDGG
jgi:hypothetical protein